MCVFDGVCISVCVLGGACMSTGCLPVCVGWCVYVRGCGVCVFVVVCALSVCGVVRVCLSVCRVVRVCQGVCRLVCVCQGVCLSVSGVVRVCRDVGWWVYVRVCVMSVFAGGACMSVCVCLVLKIHLNFCCDVSRLSNAYRTPIPIPIYSMSAPNPYQQEKFPERMHHESGDRGEGQFEVL